MLGRLAALVLLVPVLGCTDAAPQGSASVGPGSAVPAGGDASASSDSTQNSSAPDGGPTDGADPTSDAGTHPDGAAPDALDAPAADATLPDPWPLPPCYRACDRVVACGVQACAGMDWVSAGVWFEACFGACDDGVAQELLAAPACHGVLAQTATLVPAFDEGCGQSSCDQACKLLAGCIVDECPLVGPAAEPVMAADCVNDCDPQATAWVLQSEGCAPLVEALSNNDPSFAEACHGSGGECAPPDLCAQYGAKLGGCIVEHCGAPAEPYATGLAQVIAGYCAGDPSCPSQASVEGALAPTVTCDTPGLDTIGHGPPFQDICEGTVGASPEQAQLACETLVACPGTDWLQSVDACMVLLATLEDAATRIGCLTAAPSCPAAYACLEGL